MFVALLALLTCVIMALTLWGMYRLRRGVLLSFIAGLARRNLPLEAALAAVSDRHEDAAIGTRLAGRLAYLLGQGWSLPAAMRELRLLTSGEVVALQAAQQSGTAAGLLDVLAQRALNLDRRLLRLVPLFLYPLAVGLVMLSISGFIFVFIIPKFDAMCREMGLSIDSAMEYVYYWWEYGMWPIAGLFLWGLLLVTAFVHPVGAWLWWRVPVAGDYFRLREQALLARNLGFLLQARVPLERALAITNAASAGGPFSRELSVVAAHLTDGVPVCEAFGRIGRWRPEFLWALASVGRGAPPAGTFETMARVLEDKADESLHALSRAGTPLVVLLSAMSVGLLAYGIFGIFSALQAGLL